MRGGGGPCRRPWGLGGGHGEEEKGEGATGNLFPASIWAGAQRGGRSMAACGEQQRRPWRRRCGLGRRARGGGGSRGGGGLRGAPIYRRNKAVEGRGSGARPARVAAGFNGGGGRLGTVPLERRGEQWAAVSRSGDSDSWAVARRPLVK